MDVTDEKLILSNLIVDEDYVSRVLPFLQSEYFQNNVERALFDIIRTYIQNYNNSPNRTTLIHDARESKTISEREITDAEHLIKEICSFERPTDREWLIKKTEEFCQNKAVYNAIVKSISIYDGSDKETSPHSIPELLRSAISISFDSHIGMDYFDDTEARYEYYTLEENKIPFDLHILNGITNGGLGRKSLNLILAGLHVGKTLSMISLACDYAKLGQNVLYLTLEMREEEILMRMDANLLKTPINKLKEFGRDVFINKVEKIRQKSYGQIKVKEFPTGAAHTGHFKHVIDELKLKFKFIPDVIFVDYLGIVGSSRMKMGSQNSYFYLKAVSEELRALAQETNTVLWSAMQLNREGISSTDPELTNVAEAISVLHTADFAISITRTEELDSAAQILFKQQKNRFGNKTDKLRFIMGVDLEKQILHSVNNAEQTDLIDEKVQMKINTDTKSLKDKFKKLND